MEFKGSKKTLFDTAYGAYRELCNYIHDSFFDENDTPYWFDHAWYSERGIHKGESLEDLFKKICDKKRKAAPKNDPERADKFKNIKYEIFEVPAKSGLCWSDYIDWVWKQKLVYKG